MDQLSTRFIRHTSWYWTRTRHSEISNHWVNWIVSKDTHHLTSLVTRSCQLMTVDRQVASTTKGGNREYTQTSQNRYSKVNQSCVDYKKVDFENSFYPKNQVHCLLERDLEKVLEKVLEKSPPCTFVVPWRSHFWTFAGEDVWDELGAIWFPMHAQWVEGTVLESGEMTEEKTKRQTGRGNWLGFQVYFPQWARDWDPDAQGIGERGRGREEGTQCTSWDSGVWESHLLRKGCRREAIPEPKACSVFDATSVQKVALLTLSFHSLSPFDFFATFDYIVVESQNLSRWNLHGIHAISETQNWLGFNYDQFLEQNDNYKASHITRTPTFWYILEVVSR